MSNSLQRILIPTDPTFSLTGQREDLVESAAGSNLKKGNTFEILPSEKYVVLEIFIFQALKEKAS